MVTHDFLHSATKRCCKTVLQSVGINLKIRKVHMHKTSYLKGIVGVFLHKLESLHVLEKGGGIPQLEANNEGPRIRRSEHGRIPRRYF